MKYLALFFCASLSLNTLATPYSLENHEVDAYLERTVETGYGLGRINGFGLDSPFIVRTGADDKIEYSNVFTLDVDHDKFIIDFIKNTAWVEGIIFRLTESDYVSTTSTEQENFWGRLKVDTNIEGLGVSSGLGWVELNFSKIRFTADSYITTHFNHKVPEPMPFGLFLLGLSTLCLRKLRLKNSSSF